MCVCHLRRIISSRSSRLEPRKPALCLCMSYHQKTNCAMHPGRLHPPDLLLDLLLASLALLPYLWRKLLPFAHPHCLQSSSKQTRRKPSDRVIDAVFCCSKRQLCLPHEADNRAQWPHEASLHLIVFYLLRHVSDTMGCNWTLIRLMIYYIRFRKSRHNMISVITEFPGYGMH